MDNQELAELFTRIADLLEIKGENAFKVQAYRRAAEVARTMDKELTNLPTGELLVIPGIGKALAEKITEIAQTGKLPFLSRLEEEVPPSLLDLLEVHDLGPKKASLFWRSLNITTLEDLENAAKAGKLRDLPGMGEKSEARILAGIQKLRENLG